MRSLPNILTIFRMAAPILVFALVVFVPSPYGLHIAFGLFLFAAFTDFLDGYLARRFDYQSEFGRILDPISDKVLVLTTGFIMIGGHLLAVGRFDLMLILPFALIIMRELIVSGLREGLAGRATLPVTWSAKMKSATQMLAVALLFVVAILNGRLSGITQGMDEVVIQGILGRAIEDEVGLISTLRFGQIADILLYVFFWLAAVLSWLSALQYIRQAMKVGKAAA